MAKRICHWSWLSKIYILQLTLPGVSYSSTLLLLLQLLLEKQLVIFVLRHGSLFFVPFLPTLQRNKALCGCKECTLNMSRFIFKFVRVIMQVIVLISWHSSLNWKVRWLCHLEMLSVYSYPWCKVFPWSYVWCYRVQQSVRQTDFLGKRAESEESSQAYPPVPSVHLRCFWHVGRRWTSPAIWIERLFSFNPMC